MAEEPSKSKTNFYHIPTWLTLGNLVLLITLSYNFGTIKTELKEGIEHNSQSIQRHTNDNKRHIELDKLLNDFVPRNEVKSELEGIKKQLDRIEKKL